MTTVPTDPAPRVEGFFGPTLAHAVRHRENPRRAP
jgi:hypothetical protein